MTITALMTQLRELDPEQLRTLTVVAITKEGKLHVASVCNDASDASLTSALCQEMAANHIRGMMRATQQIITASPGLVRPPA